MMTTPERRHSERARIPCSIPVELSDAKRESAFDADAVDLSVGGLSLRAARLPELGSTLLCSFEAMPGGATVLGRGEVVWRQARSDEPGGDFGLRFVEIDAKNQAMIDEMVAERIARIETPFTQPTPVIANLEIENVSTPVAARLVHNGEKEALFEQSLDLLSLGKGVVAHAGVSLLRGNIAQVTLRMDASTPMLVIKLELAHDPARFGEFEWAEPGSDTDPDIFASARAQADAATDDASDEEEEDESEEEESPAQETSSTLAGLGSPLPAPILAREDESSKQLPLVFRRDANTTPDPGASLRLTLSEFPDAPDRVYADEEHARALLAATELEHAAPPESAAALAARGSAPVIDQDKDEPTSPVEEVPHPGLVSALRVFAAVGEFGERAKDWARGLPAQLQLASGPRVAGSRSRKVTSVMARTHAHEEALPKLTKAALCVLALGATGLLAFVFMPAAPEPAPESVETDVRAATDDAQLVSAANPSAGPEAEAGNQAAPAPPAYAVDTRASNKPAAAPAPAASSPKLMAAPSVSVFGQAQVPHGKRYLLRMSNPVGMIQGVAEQDGFSVMLPANKALEKAAPIKSGIHTVASAAILNFKDHAELRVRFVPGKKPVYRISGQGTNLEILIAP